ncbi:MAG: class F sortase [Cryobacterium sp.]
MNQGRATGSRLALLVVALLCLGGCASAPAVDSAAPAPLPQTSSPSEPDAPPVDPPAVPRVQADLDSNQIPTTVAPTRVRVDTLDIDMSVTAVGLAPTGDMELLVNPAEAAWYRFGSAPASSSGATVIAAHVDAIGYGLGPFARLADASPGTEVVVTTADGADQRYRVESVTSDTKADILWDTVFDREGGPRLTLVTCGGEFDYTTRTYSSNVITTAIPIA